MPHFRGCLIWSYFSGRIESKCGIAVRIDWLLKGASKVQIHNQSSSQSQIFKAFHCSVGRVPWHKNKFFMPFSINRHDSLPFFFIPAISAIGFSGGRQSPPHHLKTCIPSFSRIGPVRFIRIITHQIRQRILRGYRNPVTLHT